MIATWSQKTLNNGGTFLKVSIQHASYPFFATTKYQDGPFVSSNETTHIASQCRFQRGKAFAQHMQLRASSFLHACAFESNTNSESNGITKILVDTCFTLTNCIKKVTDCSTVNKKLKQ